ncbi:MAG: hypothetical protein UY92_C0014G0040 [Candidatus Magasanikbacteria bacterium GW2011_GWA2_56_11]|uniref:Cyclic phosphodiesterase-like protein n=1 Tax=Candidatus Magasanikbacteria bacterium GW2011_GWA2_56_11 TaxID=1619044 RepID=A0A0G1YEW4_9BACT|nr:MAG: hypothetical protein UY92_C0014G0040 [Candidatus Magasanikbacteria bacterium GW2011_GWA2_56_11]
MNTISKKLAIDVAILPPLDVMEKIIDINQQAATRNAAWGPLAKDDFLPHMSLAMGGIEDDSLETVKSIVEGIVKNFSPILVELAELYYAEKSDGSKIYAVRARKSSELQRLHENLMNGLRQYFSYDCTKGSLFSRTGEEVAEPDWINKFAASHSFEAFDPHITIRTKEAAGQEILPLKFTATKVAACHVGIMTTCRKELFAVEMTV